MMLVWKSGLATGTARKFLIVPEDGRYHLASTKPGWGYIPTLPSFADLDAAEASAQRLEDSDAARMNA